MFLFTWDGSKTGLVREAELNIDMWGLKGTQVCYVLHETQITDLDEQDMGLPLLNLENEYV